MTEQQFNQLVEIKIQQLLKAAADYHNNPDKAKEYIIKTVKNIVLAGKHRGQMAIIDELFE